MIINSETAVGTRVFGTLHIKFYAEPVKKDVEIEMQCDKLEDMCDEIEELIRIYLSVRSGFRLETER